MSDKLFTFVNIRFVRVEDALNVNIFEIAHNENQRVHTI